MPSLEYLLVLLIFISFVSRPIFLEGRRGGTLVVGSLNSPRHLNPAIQSGIATAIPGTQIFASPLRYDANWNPQPYLAEKWSISKDGLSVTLNLRKNAYFHDGKKITSEDVAFSVMTIKAYHPFKSMFSAVIKVDTPDPLTAVIRLSKPHPALMLALSPALSPIIPKHIYGDGQNLRTHPANAKPVGSGPFKLVEFKPGEYIILERSDNYFLPNRPFLDRVIIKLMNDVNALTISVEKEVVQLYPFLNDSFVVERLKKVKNVLITSRGYEGIGPINWLAFNLKHPILKQKKVRQAIAYAIDRSFITKVLHRGLSNPQRSPIIESSPFFNPKVASYPLDLEKSRSLLDQAGYRKKKKHFSLTIDFIPGAPEQHKLVAEYLKSQLKKIGIEIIIRSSPDFPTWARRISNYDFDLTMDLVFNWGDPVIGVHRTYLASNIVKGVIWANTQNYVNQEVDKILQLATVAHNLDERRKLYRTFQHLVAEDLPVYWINSVPYQTAYSKKLVNPPTSIWGVMSPLDDVYWKSN